MICSKITDITGISCYPLDDKGDVAYLAVPFTFEDGSTLPVYIKKLSDSHIKFFDDGEIVLHFIGRGLRGEKRSLNTTFLKNIALSHNLNFTEAGVLEGSSDISTASQLFSNYLSALFAIMQWEKEYLNNDNEILDVIARAEFALSSWRPKETLVKNPVFKGQSGKEYDFTFLQANEGILVINSSSQSINAATRKLLDVSISMQKTDIKTRVIVADTNIDPKIKEQNNSLLSHVCDYIQSIDDLELIAQTSHRNLSQH